MIRSIETGPGRNHAFGWVPVALVAWLVIFGAYEVLERTFLYGASPRTLHVLHILRGTGTSFLMAGLVAWYILRRYRPLPEPLPPEGGLRTILVENEMRDLASQAAWIVRLRWIAVAGILLTTAVCRCLLGAISDFSTLALLLVAAAMAGYNAYFRALPVIQLATLRATFAQVFLDLAALTLMTYFTGGIHNPFTLFYIFHIVIAGILLGRRETFLVAGAACVLFCVMALLQGMGILPSYPLRLGGSEIPQVRWGWHLGGVLGAFAATAFCTAYFTTTIMRKLRSRGRQILEAGEILSQERAKTEDVVRSVGAGLLILDRSRRVAWANGIARGWFGERIVGAVCHQELWRDAEPCLGCPLPATLSEGSPGTTEHSLELKGRRRFFLITTSPIRSADGRVDQVLELVQDVTLRKEMEIQLAQAGKMAAVGQLAAGIAHEINNPLATVASSAEILSGLAHSDGVTANGGLESLRRHLDKIEQNVYRVKGIIQNLLAFARREDEGFEAVDLAALLDDTARLVRGSASARGCEIRRAASDGIPPLAHSKPRLLQQAFLNLLLNAMDAMATGGKVEISLKSGRDPDRGDGIQVAVADTGCGISPEHLPRIFEPFFSTKPVGKGTGLGLYLVHRIVETLGGTISVASAPGEGTVFRLWLPLDSRVAAEPASRDLQEAGS